MLPFNDPNLQQGMFNPNFNSQNALLGGLNGANPNNLHGLNPNLQPMAQNNQLGVLQLLAAQIQSNPQLQMNLLHQLQSQNLASSFQLAAPFQQGGMPFLSPNPNQMMGMLNGQFLAPNQMLQGNQMMGFLGSPPFGQNNIGLGIGNIPSTLGFNPVYGSQAAVMESKQPCASSSPKKTQWNNMNMLQANGSQQFQVNHVEAKIANDPRVNSQNSASEDFARNFGFGKELSHSRFQKFQSHGMRNSKGSTRQFNKRGGKGQPKWREQKSLSANSGQESSTVSMRPLFLHYTKTEIQQWREARKKNFPTRANVNKMKANESNEDADSKLRRQQLKEVLAKQAELGVEVAEIPPSYLLEPEKRVPKKESEREVTDWPYVNKFNKKRGRGRGRDNWHSNRGHERDNWHSKRQKHKKRGEPASPPSVKREPSLLEKLLSSDIKRDKSRLLQVFRFMVLNDFFKQWPARPLDFPNITVKDEVIGSESPGGRDPSPDVADSPANEADKKTASERIGSLKESLIAEDMEYESDEEDSVDINGMPNHTVEEEDRNGEQLQSEEGEITD